MHPVVISPHDIRLGAPYIITCLCSVNDCSIIIPPVSHPRGLFPPHEVLIAGPSVLDAPYAHGE